MDPKCAEAWYRASQVYVFPFIVRHRTYDCSKQLIPSLVDLF